MRITPLLLLVLLSGCGKHEKPPMKGQVCGGGICTATTGGTVVMVTGSETIFQRDYAVLRPQIDECEKYAHAEDMDHLRECYVRVAPLANKVAAEANADETITANTIEVELLALDDDVLAFQIRQQMDEIDKRVKKLSHNRERPSRISP